ncbi:hypothetical protein HZC20_01890 [Candidatus Peregrinibacteria bacterium]|nr:hypothetical protein [Candidatus Peregrinibacteria bacterium]
MGEVFIPSYVVGFGILLVIVEAWWRLGDPEATVQILGLSTKVWGVLIALLGGYVFVDYVIKNGFTKEIGIAMGFTVVLNAIFIGIYFLRGYFYRKKHGKA